MSRRLTTEERALLENIGFGDYMIDFSGVDDDFLEAFLTFCHEYQVEKRLNRKRCETPMRCKEEDCTGACGYRRK